jgi:hypothetical protein
LEEKIDDHDGHGETKIPAVTKTGFERGSMTRNSTPSSEQP